MQLQNWLYTTLLSIIWFAVQADAQYSSSTVYTPPPYTPPPYTPPSSYGPPDYGATVTVTSTTSTTVTSVSTTTTTSTVYSQAPYGYDNTYITPMKKKTGLIIGLVVGLCGLALLLLVGFLLFKRKKKVVGYGKDTTDYGKDTTPTTGYGKDTTPATGYGNNTPATSY